jgi:hypothetical protein
MKRILIVLFMLGAFTSVFAQSGRGSSRDVVLGQPNHSGVYSNDNRNDNNRYGNNRYGSNGNMSERERDYQIQRINREYDARIWEVKRDRYLRNGERNRQIRFLEKQRREEIQQINERFSDSRSRGNGRNNGRW